MFTVRKSIDLPLIKERIEHMQDQREVWSLAEVQEPQDSLSICIASMFESVETQDFLKMTQSNLLIDLNESMYI